MKALLALLFLVPAALSGMQLSFVVADAHAPQEDYRRLLEAFDAFSEVARREPALYTLSVDVARKKISVQYSGSKTKREVGNALLAAFTEKEAGDALEQVEALKKHILGLQQELAGEKSPARREILQYAIQALFPPLDPPPSSPCLHLLDESPNPPTAPAPAQPR